MTESEPQRGPLARRDRAEKTALFRYQLIREAADKSLTTRQRGPLVRALAAAEHTGPSGEIVRYSRETLDRWISAWQRKGFDGLKPRERAAGPVTPVTVLSLAATLKLERPHRTAAQVRRIMAETLGDAPSESTLLRHFRTLEIPTGTQAQATGRFEAARPNEIWVGDGLHGPRIGGRKTYLFAFLDDHSRLVTAARWAFAEDAVRLSAALRPALQAHGIPDAVYVDNGSAFVDASLARICARLGMKLIHSRPYRPQGRGKIERFFNTVSSQFLSEITVLQAPVQTTVPGTGPVGNPGEDPDGTAITSLEELNALFISWVQMVYHRAVHSTTAMTPLARWDAGWENRRPDRRAPDVIAEAFRWSATRKVTKTATVSLQGNTYQVDPGLAGTRVELVYDPFDLTGPVAVTTAGGVPAGEAVLLEIRRHVHPKAVNAAKDADAGARNAASGIDYLRLLETRHKTAMTGAPISYDKITTTAATTTTVASAAAQTPGGTP
ncbi:DDE-type integrase/transposase/recombinase [Arthrobacter sp. CG_A4]|uniref:DDE-type integrase/transposase/recombinase n=1 Tax=Arthrobacter sp. CG_A4 TaxID=3071706 RepID=UPI002E0CE52E|nr:putative transposase [Arthrobacter sp. CG_A4]